MDIVRKMREIVNKNTKYYKSDFDIDNFPPHTRDFSRE